MKFIFFIILMYHSSVFADVQKKTINSLNGSAQVGSVYRSPIEYKNHFYFLASSGSLYQSDLDFKKLTALFKTEKKTISAITRDKNQLYFGDGLHHDETSFFYSFNLKSKKIIFKKKIKGHIEKKPLIYKDQVIFSAGGAGLISLNKKTGETNWKIKRHLTQSLHIDSTPIIKKGILYFSSIYKNKGLFSADVKTGKILSFLPSKEDIKNDLIDFGKFIVSLETKATVNSKDRNISTLMRIFDVKQKKYIKDIKLRGHNFFIRKTNESTLSMGLSSGDIIKISIPDLKPSYLNLYPEPIMSSSFKYNDLDCFFSTLGRFSCYNEKGIKKLEDQNQARAAFGEISLTKNNKKIIIPTRIGYLLYTPKSN